MEGARSCHQGTTQTVDQRHRRTVHQTLTGPKHCLQYNCLGEYGDIDDNTLAENEKRLVEPWDGVEQLENVFTHIHECIDFTEAAEQPYTDKQILSKALAIVFNMGLYADDIKEWNKFAGNLKNLATFKTHFLNAQKTLRKQRATTKQMGYGLAAVQIQEISEQFANFVSSERAEKAADCATKNC
jgi:hypothetical protein